MATSEDMINVMLWQDMPRARVEQALPLLRFWPCASCWKATRLEHWTLWRRMMPAAGFTAINDDAGAVADRRSRRYAYTFDGLPRTSCQTR